MEETGYSLVVRDGKFNWGKLLSNDERRQLHSRKLRSVKDKGKGKKSSTSRADQQQPDDDNILRDFYLENLNLNIEKVRKFDKFYRNCVVTFCLVCLLVVLPV